MSAPRNVKAYRTRDGVCPFRKWYWGLAQRPMQLAVDARVNRLATGNPGDCRSVGAGVLELRIHLGLRVYFAYDSSTLVLLLAGGDKATQQKDIQRAQAYKQDYDLRKGGSHEGEDEDEE